MRIAIDISPTVTGHSLRGVGVYTKHLVEALQKYEGNHSYTFFTHKQNVPNNVDLVHYPYFDPFFLTLPILKPKPTVVTVHDLTPLVFPDKFPKGVKGAVKWYMQKASLKGISRIITDSESSKKDISKLTGFDKGEIDAVYLAADPIFSGKHAASSSKPYFLYVGDVNWNKNVPGLLRAFAKLKSSLTLVGSAFLDDSIPETKDINRLITALGIEQSVRRTGHVSDEKLATLYAGAIALVQPSFYEGFGLPVVEAMCAGCPVLVSDTSSLTEIAGPAIRVGTQPESIERGMHKMVTLDRKLQVAAQLEWVKRFTWKETARKTIQSYEKVLESL